MFSNTYSDVLFNKPTQFFRIFIFIILSYYFVRINIIIEHQIKNEQFYFNYTR